MEKSKNKVGNVLKSVKEHWKNPPEGRYIPYKEILSYSIGGIGVKFVLYTVSYIGLSATSLLAGAALGLKNGDLVKLNLIATVIGMFLGPLRGMIIDNTRSKNGKFRPYLIYAGIPSAVVTTVFAFLPFESMSYNGKLWSLFITYMMLQLCYPFYDQAYTTLVQVMSPNSTERADVITISTFIYSLAPSVMGFVVPIVAGFAGGLEHINAYRVIMPVQAGVGNVTTWYFYYGIKDTLGLTTEQQGVLNGTLTTIIGAAATPAMLLSPFLIRKIGKRNLFIMYVVCSVFCFAGMYVFIEQIWVLFVFIWLRGFFSTFTLITDGAMNADVLDYQQYKTGERLEGLMSQFVGIIGTFVSMGVTYLIQTIIMQNHYGLVNNYDDLYNVSFREPLSKGMIALAAVGYVISLIPFITMYTLTEEEHEAHISVLKIRAALEDYATECLSEGELEEAKNIYADAVNELEICRDRIDIVKGKEKRKLKNKMKALQIVINEKDRFNDPKMIKKTEKAKELLSHSVEELYGISEPSMDKYNAANAMSESTKEEIRSKSAALKEASKELDHFHKKAYAYIQARKLLKQLEYYSHWSDIFSSESVEISE